MEGDITVYHFTYLGVFKVTMQSKLYKNKNNQASVGRLPKLILVVQTEMLSPQTFYYPLKKTK